MIQRDTLGLSDLLFYDGYRWGRTWAVWDLIDGRDSGHGVTISGSECPDPDEYRPLVRQTSPAAQTKAN